MARGIDEGRPSGRDELGPMDATIYPAKATPKAAPKVTAKPTAKPASDAKPVEKIRI